MLELHAIASKKQEGSGRFAVAMTAQENERFSTGIRRDYEKYYSMLGSVNAEASDCSRAADRESIHEGIRRSVGFGKLSRMVFGVMEGWMEEQLRGQAAASAAAADEEGAMRWNHTLAQLLLQQGRNDEAVVIFEACLKVSRRVWPENHPDIGVMRLLLLIWRVTLTHSVLGNAMSNLAGAYRALGRHQDALVLLEQTLQFWRRVLPENHPHIGAMRLWLLLRRVTLTRSVLGGAMHNLAAAYNMLGRHQDALVLLEKSLEFQRRVLPENHSDIGVMRLCLLI